ncbi:MAG: hypothetical protein ACI4XB_00750 [Ruminococcus sp.]
MWECPNCHEENPGEEMRCLKCNSPRPLENTFESSDSNYSGRRSLGTVPGWMHVVSFLIPPIGWLLMTGLVARDDDTAAGKVCFTSIISIIIYVVVIALVIMNT